MNISFINKPFGWILESIAGLVGGNFAASIFLILIPLSIKSQKSSVQQTRIKPKLDELKKRYGDDKQRYNAEMQKLYQEENVSMSGGCLPLILRLIFMMSIYWIILSPLTYLMHIDKNVISEAVKTLGTTAKSGSELAVIDAVRNGTIDSPAIAKALESINFEFFGINLTQTPNFSFNIFNDFQTIWIMPIIAFGAQILSSLLSMAMQKKINPDAPSMNSMLLMMPLISLFIGFSLPGGVTFYWACSSLIGGLIQTGIQFYYGPHKMLARERIKELKKQSAFEEGQIKKLGSTETE